MSLFTTKPLERIMAESEGGEHSLKKTLGATSLIALGIGALAVLGVAHPASRRASSAYNSVGKRRRDSSRTGDSSMVGMTSKNATSAGRVSMATMLPPGCVGLRPLEFTLTTG